MKIRKEIEEYLPLLKKIRRELHQYPEVGFDTFQTMAVIRKYMPIKPVEDDGFSGVFYLKGNTESCLAFRCELDGLPIVEKNDKEYASKNENMHACGHDLHTALLICLCIYLKKHAHQSYLFLFQSGEESGGGALKMIEKKIFEKYNIKALLATHVMPSLGDVIGYKANVMMAQSCEVNFNIEGKSAHAAHPSQGNDAIKSMVYILNEVEKIQQEDILLHFGKASGGQVRNAIASHARIEGTLRSYEPHLFQKVKQKLIQIGLAADSIFHTVSRVEFSRGYERLVNDQGLVKLLCELDKDACEVEKMMLSEDFSFYGSYCPCCLFLCGLTSTKDLHDAFFVLDEKEGLKAFELYVRYSENL